MRLTIERYDKLDGLEITLTYRIREVKEHTNFYDFIVINQESGFSSVIGLKRDGEWEEDMKAWSYGLLWNGQDTVVSVTSDWIEDKRNMVKAILSIIEEHPW